MKKVVSAFLLGLYFFVVMYVLFEVTNIDVLENFISAIMFEAIGFIILAFLVYCNMFSNHIKIGYFVPLIMVTVVYTILLDALNIVLAITLNKVLFMLVNLILLFVYFLISIPMYLMGRR